ncbi:L,D-transpeptidase family protein [Nocardioides daphniae]|nr:L,D-transpeptidase family protein [Nocardioides daphniae]
MKTHLARDRALRTLGRLAALLLTMAVMLAVLVVSSQLSGRDHRASSRAESPRTEVDRPTAPQTRAASPSATPSATPSAQPSTQPSTRPTARPTRKPRATLRPGPALLAPGAQGDAVRDLQHRLVQVAWLTGPVTGTYADGTARAVSGFQAKRGFPVTGEVDRRTLRRLHEMTVTPTEDQKHNRVPGLDARCRTGRVLCVDKTTRTLRWMVDGEVRMTLDARFGGPSTPTREGTFQVRSKSRDHVSSLYDTSMPFAMFFSGGQAVHYSPDFAARGYAGASHGCVNIRDHAGISWLYDQVRVGDRVVVHRS